MGPFPYEVPLLTQTTPRPLTALRRRNSPLIGFQLAGVFVTKLSQLAPNDCGTLHFFCEVPQGVYLIERARRRIMCMTIPVARQATRGTYQNDTAKSKLTRSPKTRNVTDPAASATSMSRVQDFILKPL